MWNMSTKYDMGRLYRAIEKYGQSQYHHLGLALGFVASEMDSSIGRIPTDAGKIRILLDKKRAGLSDQQFEMEVLEACGKLPESILGDVLREMNMQGQTGQPSSVSVDSRVAHSPSAGNVVRETNTQGQTGQPSPVPFASRVNPVAHSSPADVVDGSARGCLTTPGVLLFQSLDPAIKEDVCDCVDIRDPPGDWKSLAAQLGLRHPAVKKIERETDHTKHVIEKWETRNNRQMPVHVLQDALRGVESQHPALEIIANGSRQETRLSLPSESTLTGGVSPNGQTVADRLTPTGNSTAANGDVGKKEHIKLAEQVRLWKGRLGLPWGEWRGIPVDVLHDVCTVTAQKQRRFADGLGVTTDDLMEVTPTAIPSEGSRDIVSLWVKRQGRRATLEVLFEVVAKLGVLGHLEGLITKRIDDAGT